MPNNIISTSLVHACSQIKRGKWKGILKGAKHYRNIWWDSTISLRYRFWLDEKVLSRKFRNFVWYLQSLKASAGSRWGRTWAIICCRDSKVLSILVCFFPDCMHQAPTCLNSSSPVRNLCSSWMDWITRECLSTSANQTLPRFKRPFRGSPSLAHLSLL